MTKEQHFYGRTYRVVKKLEESKIPVNIFFYLITVTEIIYVIPVVNVFKADRVEISIPNSTGQ